MAKQIYLTPNTAVTGDTTPFMNVLSTNADGNIEVVTTGGTINTFSPTNISTKWYETNDVVVKHAEHKYFNHKYFVDGNLNINIGNIKTIGDQTFRDDAYLGIKGDLMVTGTLNIGGDLEIIHA